MGTLGAVLAVAIPLALAIIFIFRFASYLLPGGPAFHTGLVTVIVLVLAGAVALAAAGVPIAWCLGVVVVAPWIAVAVFEVRGHRQIARRLDEHGISPHH